MAGGSLENGTLPNRTVHLVPILQLVTLLAVANGAPVIATRVLQGRGAHPLDGRVRWTDGQPLFGASKTIRGLLFSVLTTTVAAAGVGLPWRIGAVIGISAMAGDLTSSFVKRRLQLSSGSRATGLDQIPESLLPALFAAHRLSLSASDVTLCVAIFFVGEIAVSRLLYRLHVRDRPY